MEQERGRLFPLSFKVLSQVPPNKLNLCSREQTMAEKEGEPLKGKSLTFFSHPSEISEVERMQSGDGRRAGLVSFRFLLDLF